MCNFSSGSTQNTVVKLSLQTDKYWYKQADTSLQSIHKFYFLYATIEIKTVKVKKYAL